MFRPNFVMLVVLLSFACDDASVDALDDGAAPDGLVDAGIDGPPPDGADDAALLDSFLPEPSDGAAGPDGPALDAAIDGRVNDATLLEDVGPDPDAGTLGPDGGPIECGHEGDARLLGSRVVYQPLQFSLLGPPADEGDAAPNPFLDFRMDVVFTAPGGRELTVPGFLSRAGIWSVRFTPDVAGEWTYQVDFRAGAQVAIADVAAGPTVDPHGAAGRFCVQPADPDAPGFLAHGPLRYVDAHYLRHDDGTWWIKGGADSPENFLAYAGFTNTEDQPGGLNTDGLQDGLHRYEPHVRDWRPGDPDWDDGAGRGIIGALNYLAEQEVNSIYFLPCNLGGDGRDTYPYLDPADLTRFDPAKLDQWESVFSHAQRLGIALHVVLNETEAGNENLHDGGQLGVERKLYYRELVARFAHHPALFWNIGEENDYGPDRQREFAGWLRGIDPYDHPITVHTHVNRPGDQYDALVGDPRFELASIQLSPNRANEFAETWRARSAEAGRPWVVMLDEIGPAGTGVTDENADALRRSFLWPALLSGAGGVEWYFGYHALPLGGDVRTEDFRTREAAWTYTRHARAFVESLQFWEMEPADELLAGAGQVFASADRRTLGIYLPDARDATLDLAADFSVRWFDPRTRDWSEPVERNAQGGLGAPPGDGDWAASLSWVRDAEPAPVEGPRVTALRLVDADRDEVIGPLLEGELDLNALPTRNLNVEAVVAGPVASVVFEYGERQVENVAPYALAGDTEGDFNPWTPALGPLTIRATAYSEGQGAGEAGPTLEVELQVVEGAAAGDGRILFVRGGPGTGGFLEGGADEQLSDIDNPSVQRGNHGWAQLASLLREDGFELVQRIEDGPVPLDDLADFDVVVFGSNNAAYDDADADAVDAFVRAGGGALFISDANWGSFWNAAPDSDQTFLTRFDMVINQDQGTYQLADADLLQPQHPILQGVERFDGEGVSPVTIVDDIADVNPVRLAVAKGNIRRNTAPQGPSTPATDADASLAAVEAGEGRVAVHFDRNTFFNENGAGTSIQRFDNARYARNLFGWLAGDSEDGLGSWMAISRPKRTEVRLRG